MSMPSFEQSKVALKEKVQEKEQDKLFDIFYQANNSRHWEWYWLWLSIVKKIIVLHNLKISLKIENWFFKITIN